MNNEVNIHDSEDLEEIIDYIKIFKRFKIFNEHPILILWLGIYMLITLAIFHFSFVGFMVTIAMYLITISAALSDTIEIIMRNMEDARELAVRKEKERLLPLFDEVYQKVKDQTPEISKNIKLYIVDEIAVNAFALGRNTIAVTRGLIEVMDDEEIKGILAHEMGHMANDDSRVQTLITFGSAIYLWLFLIARWILRRIEAGTAKASPFTSVVIGIIRFIVDLTINVTTLIATLLLMVDSREKEYKADQYAAKTGYVFELKQALYKLYDMQISDKRSLIQRFKASHPRIAYRIGRLEELEEMYSE